MERFGRVDLKDTQLARRFLNKALNRAIGGFMVLHQIQQWLQAAFAQPAFHTLEPLRGVIHLRRHRSNHHQRFRPLLHSLTHRNGIADPTIQVIDPLQRYATTIEPWDRAGRPDQIKPVLRIGREIVRRVVITPTGAHVKRFPGFEQARGGIHL
ncbi:hypothetical protein SDC9_133734 [bioreactor metagenome]|uniref:Uncharacterized protein n=1 Tax=bioreactor metagenome TaxID=1076179 RepID=A0A645DBC0_9ZZZZ